MKLLNSLKEKGISLRYTHVLMMVISIAIAGVLLFETVSTMRAFRDLSKAADNFINMQSTADELMKASDYLTEESQKFVVTGERVHMDNYFHEADVTRRRENSVEAMKEISGESQAVGELEKALGESAELMDTEYYAMKLMAEAAGIGDLPEALVRTELSAEDTALSSEQKIKLAQKKLHDVNYYNKKDAIRADMDRCLDRIEAETRGAEVNSDSMMRSHVIKLLIIIVVQTVVIIANLLLTSYLGINPLLNGVQEIKEERELPVVGSYEFRYLAKTYNKMYETFKKSIASLNYDASHDKLTGVYNRKGYDFLKESVDLKTSALLLIDADHFKEINDNHGHTIGDCVLKKVAKTLSQEFRSEDYICRIGGDEFVVFMLHVNADLKSLIENKVHMINTILSDPQRDSLPPLSVSVGVAFGENEEDTDSLIKHADEALYMVKERGRKGCCFY
ncbi:MAG: GGDEF domain-containing protein [Ruminococcus sp.]|nr:GGDEF domain-containing protein [Ruminococcus sp.]